MKVNFDPKQGLIPIQTRLFGSHTDTIVRLALDTGATGTMINWDVAVLLSYDPASVKERVQVTTGSGVEFAPRILIRKVEALGLTSVNFPVLCHTLPPSATVDVVLGLDFFRGKLLIIDLNEGFVNVK
ncbi:retropepsin-like domain-containing protein [bacterium]|nr:retropepsin-like domain-containing protein [bacterium]